MKKGRKEEAPLPEATVTQPRKARRNDMTKREHRQCLLCPLKDGAVGTLEEREPSLLVLDDAVGTLEEREPSLRVRAEQCPLLDGAVGTLEEREPSLRVRVVQSLTKERELGLRVQIVQRSRTWWGQSSHQMGGDSIEAVDARRWHSLGKEESRFVVNVATPTWWLT